MNAKESSTLVIKLRIIFINQNILLHNETINSIAATLITGRKEKKDSQREGI